MTSNTSLIFDKTSPEQLKHFGDIVGDSNPIHWDDAKAKEMGLPGCIAHGILAVTLIDRAIREQLALTHSSAKILSIDTKFVGMMPADSLLRVDLKEHTALVHAIVGEIEQLAAKATFKLSQ